MPENWQIGGFGLYVHWPFCAAKCPYCDFNSHVSHSIDHAAWTKAYLEEIDKAARQTNGRVLQSVFFGGGTPSLMQAETVSAVLEVAARTWTFANDIEITLEANPTSVESGKFADFASAGINRVSLGIQSLNDTALKRLGRMHTADEGRLAVETACAHFNRVSADLMYALQHQTLEEWENELNQALSWGLMHYSLYQLTIEDETVFGARHQAGKLPGLPDEDLSAALFETTYDMCAQAGLQSYEISNFARPNEESRHNQIYWRSGDYVGIGPGAHGRVTVGQKRYATEQTRAPSTWLAEKRAVGQYVLSAEEHAHELLLMGLRTVDGIDLNRWSRISGNDLPKARIADLVKGGWLKVQNDTMSTTRSGKPVLNAIIRELMT